MNSCTWTDAARRRICGVDLFAGCEHNDPQGCSSEHFRMHVIARPRLKQFMRRHADARDWLDSWWKIAKAARWTSLNDVKRTYASVDQYGRCLIFNVGGNNYRFIVTVKYERPAAMGVLYIKDFLTHAEYDEDRWKGAC